jgi:hypothetical protein
LRLADFSAADAVRSLIVRFAIWIIPFTVYNPAQALAWSPIFLPAKWLEHHMLWFGRLQNVTPAAKVDALSRHIHPLEGGANLNMCN